VNLPLINRVLEHKARIAIATNEQTYTYADLLHTSSQIATNLLEDVADLQEQRIAFLIPSGFEYVATLWGIWRPGGSNVLRKMLSDKFGIKAEFC
jgi:malonyl-CoA/methylmalonyl-CoA synthetase